MTIAVNKIDRLDRARTVAVLEQAAELELEGEVFPISARTGAGVQALVEHLGRPAAGGSLPVRRPRNAPTSRWSCCSPS